jgi:hypothetical protein
LKPAGHFGDVAVTFLTVEPLMQEMVFLETAFLVVGDVVEAAEGVGVGEAFGCERATSIDGLE